MPDPSCEFVCFYCCLIQAVSVPIQAVPLFVELVGHSVCLHKCACVFSQLLVCGWWASDYMTSLDY